MEQLKANNVSEVSNTTPIRRSLGLSRRFKSSPLCNSNTNSPAPAASLQSTKTYSSPLLITTPTICEKVDENINICATPTIKKVLSSPQKSTEVSQNVSTTVKKRIHSLSLMRPKPKVLKKKKLEYTEEVATPGEEENPDVLENENCEIIKLNMSNEKVESLENTATLQQAVSLSCLPLPAIISFTDDDIRNNTELANELKSIESLKQKHLQNRIANGMKVKESKLLKLSKFEGFDSLKNVSNGESVLPPELGFHRPQIVKPKTENLDELRELIQIWRRGLRDAIEYLSCLNYPPTDTKDIIKHYHIKSEWVNGSEKTGSTSVSSTPSTSSEDQEVQ